MKFHLKCPNIVELLLSKFFIDEYTRNVIFSINQSIFAKVVARVLELISPNRVPLPSSPRVTKTFS